VAVLPVAFRDLPASAYPFTIEMLDAVTREVCWSVTAAAPGAVRIPGKHETNGGKPVACRVTFGNGEVSVAEPGE
jgi:hypothetical protein